MSIIIMTISGDIIRYDGLINIQYNGTSIRYTLSDGDNREIKMKCIKKFIDCFCVALR